MTFDAKYLKPTTYNYCLQSNPLWALKDFVEAKRGLWVFRLAFQPGWTCFKHMSAEEKGDVVSHAT